MQGLRMSSVGRKDGRTKIQSGPGCHLPLSTIKMMEFSGMPTPRATSLNSSRRLSLSCGSRPANRKQRRYPKSKAPRLAS